MACLETIVRWVAHHRAAGTTYTVGFSVNQVGGQGGSRQHFHIAMWFNRRNINRQYLVQSLLGHGVQTNDLYFKRWDLDDWDKLIEYIERQCGPTNVWEDVMELSEEERWDYGDGPDTDSTWSNSDSDQTERYTDSSTFEDGQDPDGADTSDDEGREAYQRARKAYRHYLRRKYRKHHKKQHQEETDGDRKGDDRTTKKRQQGRKRKSNGNTTGKEEKTKKQRKICEYLT